MTIQDIVRDHFNKEAARFDAIYDGDKPLMQRLVDSFRKVVVERLRLICNLAPLPGPWTALDVGCGSGRYGIAFARLGATRSVGIDVASAMIDLATAEAERAGVGKQCSFETVEFLDYRSDQPFDAVVAMGYFDYLDVPEPHVQKMLTLCRGRAFFSFPKRWDARVPVRMLRFALRKSYVRFYSRGEIARLMAGAGVAADRWSLIDFDRDWIVVVRVAP